MVDILITGTWKHSLIGSMTTYENWAAYSEPIGTQILDDGATSMYCCYAILTIHRRLPLHRAAFVPLIGSDDGEAY